jgi:hypothetical protein
MNKYIVECGYKTSSGRRYIKKVVVEATSHRKAMESGLTILARSNREFFMVGAILEDENERRRWNDRKLIKSTG